MSDDGKKITIVFRGVRGSYPMPGPTTLHYGGNTSCQEIRVGGRLLIFDAGTGIIGLGNDLAAGGAAAPRDMALFFSHNHHDHTGGILYFKPAYNPATTLYIFGPKEDPGTIMEALEQLSAPAAHPVPFSRMGMRFECEVVENGDVVCWRAGEKGPRRLEPGATIGADDVVVRVLKNPLHPVDGVLNFRLEYAGKSYVYATDVEGNAESGDPALAEFARGADLLAHDGQYEDDEYRANRKGWGHSTVEMAVKTAEMAGVKRLAIIHHEPSYDDKRLERMEREAKARFADIFFAYEGQKIEV